MTSLSESLGGGTVMPLVSVLLPVYNGGDYLPDAIDSILRQTFENFELIIIDDGSTDNSAQILKIYEGRDRRIRLIVRENRGLATTLNNLVDMARGPWIARMDQDDIALPHRLARQFDWLKATGADITGSWVKRFGTSDKRVVKLCQTDEAIKMETLFASPFAHPTVVMRSSLIKALRYDKAWEKAEDYDLWARASEQKWLMTNVPEVLLYYRIHPGQISTVTGDEQQEAGRAIRRKYWEFVFCQLHLDLALIERTLKIFESPSTGIDMDAVNASFKGLLQCSSGEAREVLLSHATRLYIRLASRCPDIVKRWNELNREFGRGRGVTTQIKLHLFRAFRVEVDSNLFRRLRKLYIWRAS